MVQLSFYGGIEEIGGNKILLEDGERKLLFDFGFPYKRHKLFYEEYLKPRGGAGLLDPLVMGLLPPLEGIYRSDLEIEGLWEQFRKAEHYRKIDHVDGVLLSHAHLDHSAHIAFLKEDIPVYATSVTAFITKAIQDSGKADFDQQVCYYRVVEQGCPPDWKQPAFLSTGNNRQRQFCVADKNPEALSLESHRFWNMGFWEPKTTKQKELVTCPVRDHQGCSFKLLCFPVDHSIPGACAWGIETSAGWIIYSGDLRLHGKRKHFTEQFIKNAASLNPIALIIEGTNVQREVNIAENAVYENGKKAIASARGLVIADFSPRDVDRLLTFLRVARETGRRLAILPKDAYLLKTMHLLEPETPDIATDKNIAIYQDTIATRSPQQWMRNICQEYENKVVLARDVREAQNTFILCFSFWDLNELPSICPDPGSLYVFSSSEPHDEEQEIDFRRLHKWLDHFKMTGFGLPLETGDDWEIPEEQRGLHASGHACGPDLLRIALQIKPKLLIPVHSEHPDFYNRVKALSNNTIKLVFPRHSETIQL
jgi:ribonuclease J